jgi:hypothetical protein
LIEIAHRLCWQTFKYIFEISVRIVTIQFGGLDQTHHHSGALAGTQRSTEQPVGSPGGHGADSVLEMRLLPVANSVEVQKFFVEQEPPFRVQPLFAVAKSIRYLKSVPYSSG